MNRVLSVGLFVLASLPAAAGANVRTYQMIDPPVQRAEGVIPGISHVIYLENCKAAGSCRITPGDYAPNMESGIISSPKTLTAYSGSDAEWQQVVQCVKDTYREFNVQITTTKPPAGSHYHVAMVAGRPTELGMDSNTLGVAPFSRQCASTARNGFIDDAMSFAFANVTPHDVANICWTVAQETAHAWGLDHKFDNRDPMTYLDSGPSFKRFQNQAGACGEYEARACNCGASSMNAHQLIMDVFGAAAPDTVPPSLTVSAPAEGAQVEPGFAIRATVSDDVQVNEAEAKVDGVSVGKVVAFPWVWNAPATLAMGSHRVEVTATDWMGNVTKKTVNVTYGAGCKSAADCSNDGDTCIDGRCVPGQGQPGGLGEPCTGNEQCSSGQCASDGTVQVCVESCDPAANACPSGFGCVETGPGAGVCFPGADGGGGGCLAAGGAPAGPLLGLAFGAMLLFRRRKS